MDYVYRAIDIETENTGIDIMKDNKRIISVQIGDDIKQNLYWADSPKSAWNLTSAEKELSSLIAQGVIFAGYNIKGFDIPLLKQLLGIEIPQANWLDICQTPEMTKFHKLNKDWTLECACNKWLVDANHKQKMNAKAEKYKTRQDIIEKAKAGAIEIKRTMTWLTPGEAYTKALKKLAGGNAVYDAYLEFKESGGQKDTLFYEYAIGDIISEFSLLKKLGY